MAAIETSRTAPLGAVSLFRSVEFVTGIFAAISNWNDARVTRNSLQKLSDHALDDIGLCRGDIDNLGR